MFADATLRRPPSLRARSAGLRAEPTPAHQPAAAGRAARQAPAPPHVERRLGPAWELSALRTLYGG